MTVQLSRKHALTQARLKEILHYDPETGFFINRVSRSTARVGERAGWIHKKGYRYLCVDGTHVKAHQAAWLYMTGEWPEAIVDHRDQDKDNNTWSNLREATNAENCRNIRPTKRNSSGVLGVGWHKQVGKWQASIRFERKLISLGYFADLNDAAKVRREAERKYFGEFAPRASTPIGC